MGDRAVSLRIRVYHSITILQENAMNETNFTRHRAVEFTRNNVIQIKRLLPNDKVGACNVFLLIEEFIAPRNAMATEAKLSNSEVFCYLFEGALLQSNSTGSVNIIEEGGAYHLVSGKGLEYWYMPIADHAVCHGIQICLNVPPSQAKSDPQQDSWREVQLPETHNKGSTTHYIVGDGSPVSAAIPLLLQDTTIRSQAHTFVAVPENMQGLAYCYRGRIEIGGAVMERGEFIVLPHHTELVASGLSESGIMLLAGVPLRAADAKKAGSIKHVSTGFY
ncbi:MAG: hypothetical protein GF398_13155 [Chitinivibrionales bacterium]|nr:hypothetical protein [Chitinivibrionales bacterium]